MAVYFNLLLHLLATTWLARAFQPLQEQQPLIQADARSPGAFGDAAFDEFVLQVMRVFHVPGLSSAVIDNGQILAKGYGTASFPDTPATPDTLYFTGSTTKAFTAAAAALLIQDQDHYPGLRWTSPINHFLRDDFVLQNDYATTHTTVEDALSHRSGLPRHDLAYGEPDDTPSTVVRRIRHLPLTAEPRTTFQYCNIMFAVVTDLLETLTGLKLETVLREKFWKPLGMASTSFGDANVLSNVARGYFWNSNKDDSSSSSESYVPEPYLNISSISGAGATISSVNDYALWIKAWLDAASVREPANASSPINRALFRDLFTPRTIIQSPPEDSTSEFLTPALYALGWATMSVKGHTIVGHGGGLTGFGTTVIFLPDDGYGIVVMGNTAGTSNLVGNLIAQVLLKRKLGLSVEESASTTTALSTALCSSDGCQGPHHSSSSSSSSKKEKGNDDELLQSEHPDTTRPERPPTKAAKLPLPGDIGNFAGLYTHPAYGVINFTVVSPTSENDSTTTRISTSPYLYGIPTPTRMWRYALQLHHVTDTLFNCKVMNPHGMDPKALVWEHVASSRAIFKFGLDGEVVETLGIELDEEMVAVAERKGAKYWKEGMIWFEKI